MTISLTTEQAEAIIALHVGQSFRNRKTMNFTCQIWHAVENDEIRIEVDASDKKEEGE